jgi:ribosomal protein S18 acetylase RimI-like enzyme
VSVRLAGPEDAHDVLALLAGLGRPEVAADPTDQRAVFAQHLADPAARVFVAADEGKVVGVASLWIRPRLNWVTPEAWLPDLFVDPAARRRGHARALLEACAAHARENGCHRLILESGHGRAEAHRLYESFGFEHYARSYQLLLA